MKHGTSDIGATRAPRLPVAETRPARGGTVFVALACEREQAVVVHWALTSGFWAFPVAPALASGAGEAEVLPAVQSDTLSEPPAYPAALVVDAPGREDVRRVVRDAQVRFLVPVFLMCPDVLGTAEEILACPCAELARRPFDLDEVSLRIRLALERARAMNLGWDRQVLRAGALELDPVSRTVMLRGAPLTLRRAEYNLLVYMLKAAPRLVTNDEIVREVLGSHGSGATARQQVYELRKKLRGADAEDLVRTVPGQGYLFDETVTVHECVERIRQSRR